MKYFLASMLSTSVMLVVFMLIFTVTTLSFLLEELFRRKQENRS